ncbi:quinone oxidoreductase family protein [Flavobacterium reichenbachii]|uniref:Alcohol dehydrogenase n=1 Tax=Flavobacterium reichenbachii TaxID=362418 RepID=A0A085ZL61_9FLAO|nr:quinone oxidoreductase [Flavobacterium reichenbachii]KFF05175.1 alcohol dehydrogenase [Flavobacterium reichenbachii]OXB16161.1 alcohol dehydrogenase [Flavobacterium reichenbachii]
MKALTFSSFGDSDVLEYIEIPDPQLKSDEILVEMKAVGLNFADVYRRKGNYHLKGNPPFIAGYEGAGIVVNTNNNPEYKVGDRVAFADAPFANAELVAVNVNHILPLPETISFETAAAVLLQGLTAHYLATDSHKTAKGETVIIHAAAGGVGQILTQISKLLGASVIGLTSSSDKAKIALEQGADHVFLYNEDWKSQVFNIIPKGADVVYDSIGSTLAESFEVTKECGQVVFFGMAGGDPAPVDPRMLMDGSKTLTGGDLWSYLNSKEERIKRATQLFNWIIEGKIKLSEPTTFKLSEGKLAHDYLESRKSTGKIILIP